MRRLDGEDGYLRATSTEVQPQWLEIEALGSLERLPVEISEIILQKLRPADLVSVAAASPRLEAVVRNPRLWRRTTVHLCGEEVNSPLRQIALAPQLGELQVGLGTLSRVAAKAIRRYSGPTPHLHSLRLRLSVLGEELGLSVLDRYGRSATHLELDLRHGLLEQPRCHSALLQRVSSLDSLERMTVRVDNVSDVFALTQLQGIKMVEIDMHRLRVGTVHQGGPGPAVGAAAAHLLSHQANHVHTLCLPPTFDAQLSASVLCCRELRTLASNAWTLPAVEGLQHLRTLHVFPPDHFMTRQDVVTLVNYAHRSRVVLSKVRELRLLKCDVFGYLPAQLASEELTLAILSLLLSICRKAEVLVIQWTMPDSLISDWSWIDTLLSSSPNHLRELRLGGNFVCPRQILALARYCPTLEILDVRRSSRVVKPGKRQTNCVTTYGVAGMRRALDLIQGVLPNLTVLFDDNVDNFYDWNFYLNPRDKVTEGRDSQVRMSSFEGEYPLPMTLVDKMFVHLMTLDQWVSAGGFNTPRREDGQFWRCATLDSLLWSTESFCHVLGKAPALGLVDCRKRGALSPGRKGLFWMKSLASGPKEIRAIRLQTSLVTFQLWGLVEKTLRKIGVSLERLELDFRGRPFRDWRDVLSALSTNPNLTELVLRGSFDDDKPVLDWLHGRLPSLRRLDLRDCQMEKDKQMPAFVESLKLLLVELRGTLSALSLPPLPRKLAAEVVRTVAELTELREVAVHVNELLGLRPLKFLCSLEVYGDRRPCKTRPVAPLLARSVRCMRDVLRQVRSLTLPADLFESQLVQEAVYDTMPNLRKLHVINEDRKLKTCIEGPRCRDRSIWE